MRIDIEKWNYLHSSDLISQSWIPRLLRNGFSVLAANTQLLAARQSIVTAILDHFLRSILQASAIQN
jgi:hypothetical protein